MRRQWWVEIILKNIVQEVKAVMKSFWPREVQAAINEGKMTRGEANEYFSQNLNELNNNTEKAVKVM